jgi:hypothetical protein
MNRLSMDGGVGVAWPRLKWSDGGPTDNKSMLLTTHKVKSRMKDGGRVVVCTVVVIVSNC